MVFFNKPMRIATLNVRGLADRRRQNQLYRLVTDGDLDIVALHETKVESEDQTDRIWYGPSWLATMSVFLMPSD